MKKINITLILLIMLLLAACSGKTEELPTAVSSQKQGLQQDGADFVLD